MRSLPTAPATGLASILPDQPAGSLALAAAVAASAQPSDPAPAADVDKPADFDFFAALTFSAAATPADLELLRSAYNVHYSPLAAAVAFLGKTSDEMADISGALIDSDNAQVIDETFAGMTSTRQWLGEAAEMIHRGQARFLAGMCRAYKSRGGRIMDYALPEGGADAAASDLPLIDLGRQLDVAMLRLQELDRAGEEAFALYDPPPIPRALFCRPEDRRIICPRPHELAADDIGGERQHFYEGGLRDLSRSAQLFVAGDAAYKLDCFPFTVADETRTREIVDAHQAWTAAGERAEAAAGLTAIYDAADQQSHRIRDLQRTIAATPARTFAGMIAKAQAAAGTLAGDHAWIVEEHFPAILAKWADEQGVVDRYKTLALSLVVDALRLAAPAATGAAA